ncbi:MAG TPA: extracellular solute-binding protein, partial [Microlunatus sp.]
MPDPSSGLLNSALSRRSLLTALGLAGAGAALAGCGAPGGGGADSLQQADMRIPDQYKDRTPVLFWAPWTKEPLAALEGMIKQFNESQKDIAVVVESQESYATLNTKLSAAVQAKRVPDVVCFPEFQWLQFYFSDLFVQLDPYFDDTFKLDNYLDAFLEQCQAAGKTYLVPFARSTPLFYYNKSAYTKAGLPEEGPKTWDDLAEFAPALARTKVAGKPMKAFAFGVEDQWFGQAEVWAWGGQYSDGYNVTIDQDPVIEWWDWQRKFIHDNKFGYMAEVAMTDYEGGLAAGAHGSTASLTAATTLSKFDVGAAFMLGQQQDETEVPTGGSGL